MKIVKKLMLFALAFTFYFTITSSVFAHGGVEESDGPVTVYISQEPISPLVGEKVKLHFTLKDKSIEIENGDLSMQNLKNIPVTISVIDTYFGDESKDKVILKKELKTDENGGFSFEYTFDRENYFDIDLDFVDSSGKNREVGLLIQPRKAKNQSNFSKDSAVKFFLLGVGTCALVFIGLKKSKNSK